MKRSCMAAFPVSFLPLKGMYCTNDSYYIFITGA